MRDAGRSVLLALGSQSVHRPTSTLHPAALSSTCAGCSMQNKWSGRARHRTATLIPSSS
eukprot:CAMPEP_0119480294 /NCGR_PEP_ID=MMETSP1344-20130328/9167_1 /TAXON_ID=236787 /ORGANISM="Florenciella parvula, Strain CCMP2471" /LENGTH=58 /DNA_ID=CAMNT_0007514587 /DNA_START=80 /DNA_END=253 /DNA_ORIENTATION=-